MQIVIDIDEEDFNIMKHNVAIDNPLCPLGEKEMVTAVANGTPIPDNVTNGDMLTALFGEKAVITLDTHNYLKNWWRAPYKKEMEE